MSDDVADLRAHILEGGLSLEELKQASADAEERRRTPHEELLRIMAALLKTSCEREAQEESGEQQSQPTAGATGRDAAPPPWEFSSGDSGSREGERAPTEAGDQLGRRGPNWGLGPIGEESSITHADLGGQLLLGQPTMPWR